MKAKIALESAKNKKYCSLVRGFDCNLLKHMELYVRIDRNNTTYT